MKSVLEILMERDGMSREDAMDLIKEVAVDVNHYLGLNEPIKAENCFMEAFGLEPDYMEDFIWSYIYP